MSKSYTAFSPINLYSPGATDMYLPSAATGYFPAEETASSQDSANLAQTKQKFKGLKVQFDDLAAKEKAAKEDLKREALRAWEDELRMEGVTWGEA